MLHCKWYCNLKKSVVFEQPQGSLLHQSRFQLHLLDLWGEKQRKKVNPIDWIESNGVLGNGFPCNSKEVQDEFEIKGDLESISKNYGSDKGKSIFHNSGISYNRKVITIDVKPSEVNYEITLGDILLDSNDVEEEFWIDSKDLKKLMPKSER